MCCITIDWNLVIATLAFIVSTISLIISIRTTKDQTLTFILNQLDERAGEANNVAYNYPDLYQEHILSNIVSIIASSEQLLKTLEDKYSRQIKPADKIFIREQFYLILHTAIRTQLWKVDETKITNETIKKQLVSSRKFLQDAYSKWH